MTQTTDDPEAREVPSFDLTSSSWIRVVRSDGSQDELSLRQVFAQADDLRCVVAGLATQEFALIRLLLAVAHDALDGPRDIEEWAELWEDRESLAPVQEYLTRHADRFDLLHPQTPFLQSAGLRTLKDEVFSLDRIVADVPAGEKFFSARLPEVERLSFAEAARWVVHVHAYDTSGIKTGMAGDDRVKGGKVFPLGTGWCGGLGGVFVEGDTLRETLLLNLVAADTTELEFPADDRPAWRRDPSGPGSTGRPATGLRDLYSWQSRRLRLHYDADGVHGVVLGYGDQHTPRNMHRREPMTAWRRSKAQEKKLGQSPVYLPLEHDPARSAWRGIAALVADRPGDGGGGGGGAEPAARLRPRILEWIARLVSEGHLKPRYLVRARLVGVSYGTQQSVVEEAVDDRLQMPVVLLHRQDPTYAVQAIAASDDADRAVRALGDLAADLARAAGVGQEQPRAASLAEGFDALEQPYRDWLSVLADVPDPFAHRDTWRRQLRKAVGRLGDRLIAAAGDAAWEGRLCTGTGSTGTGTGSTGTGSSKGAKGSTYWLNAGLADVWFRGRLARALGAPGDPESPSPAGGGTDANTPDGAGPPAHAGGGPPAPDGAGPSAPEPAGTPGSEHAATTPEVPV
ncbi:type I-E CRISPR-associated protein Cse1/CasA [Streptomyces spongiicola]|uniref:Type I-E CRISPR-associated protein Cse1/CasA n=1 Tax=Streptomyces spongiicola TaxID=1690221 RepID=A0ABM6VA56_9ACTN|nr:type I-E CRISPR-associated protein Cse1/CasA [Streptomyces spongiicola]AWK10861.1 type I-E CRISPR-associated protein Cse1/CasA [Streptomyces spongiicola]